MIKQCIICNNQFETIRYGEARKYCFDCSPTYSHGSNSGRASTITSIRHAIKRQLVRYKGGKCEKCGYDKCIGALQFHHLDPDIKDFEISAQYNGGHLDMNILYQEADKCQMICANCHSEIHFNPET